MTYFLFQSALVITIAFFGGAIVGWLLYLFIKKSNSTNDSDLGLVKEYLAESIKENARLKLQLKYSEEKIDKLTRSDNTTSITGVDFEAYQAFEDTVKEAQMRKYLN